MALPAYNKNSLPGSLEIDGISIRTDAHGRFSLNDLHRAAGNFPGDNPGEWLKLQATTDLLSALEEDVKISGIPPILKKQGLGTFACLELVYDYAAWISPAFKLKVYRTFHAVQAGTYQAQPHVGPSMKDQLAFAREVSKALRYSDTSKIRMYRILAEESGITTRILPDYTDEPLTRSLSDLLKLHGSDLSAVKANKLLVAAGYLAEIERPSRGGPKKFKSITEAGSRFGKNETSPENPNETQPRWFVNTAQELMGILDQERVRMEAA